MRRDETDEADGASDSDRAADTERNAGYHEQPQAGDIDTTRATARNNSVSASFMLRERTVGFGGELSAEPQVG